MIQLPYSLTRPLRKQCEGRGGAPVPAARRGSVDLSLINTAGSASQIKEVLHKTKDVTAWLTALQQLAKLGQQQHGQLAAAPVEAQQRIQLTSKLLSQLSSQISRMSTGSLCRLCFILSRLQSTANVTPVWQAAIRQLLQCTPPTPAAAAPAAAAPAAAAAAALTASASPGDLLYLLRALEQWAGGDHGHPVLLPAAVTAAANTAEQFTLQELILFVSTLAKMNYYNAQLMDMTAARFTAAAAATIPTTQPQQQQQQQQHTGAQQQQQYQQQQQQQGSDTLSTISDQMLVTLLWSLASLAHVSQQQQQQQQQQLLPTALHVLLSSDVTLSNPTTSTYQASQRKKSLARRSSASRQQQQQQQGCDTQTSTDVLPTAVESDKGFVEPLLLLGLNPKYLPMCAWSLAVILVCALAQCSGRPAAAAVDHGSSSSSSSSSSGDAVRAASRSAEPAAANIQQLTDLVAAVVGLSELLAAAAAAAAAAAVPSADSSSSSSSSRRIGQSNRSSGVCYDQEGLAQLHHARLLVAAAAAAAAAAGSNVVQQQLQPSADAAVPFPGSATDTFSNSNSSGAAAVNFAERNAQCAWLLQVIQPISQQKQNCVTSDQLSWFRVQCEAAWNPRQLKTSHTQQQVYQELQGLGFSVQLEVPAMSMLNCINGKALPSGPLQQQQQQQQQQLLNCYQDLAKLQKVVRAVGAEGLHIDIACTVTLDVAQQIQQQGLMTVLRQLRDSSNNSSSSNNIDINGDDCVVLAVEIDGPSHVAVNNMSHQLGSTVCRDWLLQQLGFVVVSVPWWQWDAYRNSSSSKRSNNSVLASHCPDVQR